jgi:hypothetical protein
MIISIFSWTILQTIIMISILSSPNVKTVIEFECVSLYE